MLFNFINLAFQFRYFKNLARTILNFFVEANGLFNSFGFIDAIDIVFVAIVLFLILRIVRETRSIQLIKAIILLAVIYLVVNFLQMDASTYIMKSIFSNILIIIVLLFAPEIRLILEQMGKGTTRNGIRSLFSAGNALDNAEFNEIIDETAKACANMSDNKIGALIVFEKDIVLNDIVKSGTTIKAMVTTEILENIFYPKAPLHDGAVVIRDNMVYSAGCILPLTKNNVSSSLGTRHRAAIGLSEECDAVVLVVSEETGDISIAVNGTLMQNISSGIVRDVLIEKFLSSKSSKSSAKKSRRAK